MNNATMTPQPAALVFTFNENNQEKAREIISHYPVGRERSAILPLLDLAQRQCGNWLPKEAMDYIASFIHIAPIRVYEIATFYSMFNLEPVGKHFIQICTTTPCWLRGSDDIVNACESSLEIGLGETTEDMQFTLKEVECLGACVNAPMVQINDGYYEDLNKDRMEALLDALKEGKTPAPGPTIDRINSAPEGYRPE